MKSSLWMGMAMMVRVLVRVSGGLMVEMSGGWVAEVREEEEEEEEEEGEEEVCFLWGELGAALAFESLGSVPLGR